MQVKPNNVAALLRSQAGILSKAASTDSAGDSAADGVARVTKGTIPTDPGEAELKEGLPTDGQAIDDSLKDITTQVTNPSGTPAADKGAPAEMPKAANSRVGALRTALFTAFPGAAEKAAAATADKGAPAAGAEPAKSASSAVGGLDLSPEMLIKVAKVMLATEEGCAQVERAFAKEAGDAAAKDMIKAATAASDAHTHTFFQKQAAVNEGMSKAAAIHSQLLEMITEEEADQILKQAGVHCEALEALEHPLLKAAYATGMEDGAALEEGAEAMEAPPVEGAAPGAEPEIPMGGPQLSMEDIVALLEELVASGQISQEDVTTGLAEFQAAGGAAPTEGGAPPAEAAPPVEEAPMDAAAA